MDVKSNLKWHSFVLWTQHLKESFEDKNHLTIGINSSLQGAYFSQTTPFMILGYSYDKITGAVLWKVWSNLNCFHTHFHFHWRVGDCLGQFDLFSLDCGHSAKAVNGGDWVEACRIKTIK